MKKYAHEFEFLSGVQEQMLGVQDEFKMVRMAWLPLGTKDLARINKHYDNQYENCTMALVIMQEQGVPDEGDKQEYSVATLICNLDGSSPMDTPISEEFMDTGDDIEVLWTKVLTEIISDDMWHD